MYIAIRGERFDGHRFVEQALREKGAMAALVDSKAAREMDPELPLLVVQDTVVALQTIAAAHRQRLASGGCRVIGIAGSNGKTTTRHMVHHWLTSAGLVGTQSPRSFNNHIGVPLTLLAASPDDDFVACEIGTNHPGEIAALSRIAEPDIAVITSIGEEHLEFFGDLIGVAREEASIVAFTREHGGLVVHPDTLAWLQRVDTDFNQVRLHLPEPHEAAIAPLEFPGAHNQANAQLAVEVGTLMGVAPGCGTWRGFTPPQGRLNTLSLPGGITVIQDAYNANPSSVRAALQVLAGWPKARRRVAVLGPMNELGDHSATAHAAIRQETQALADAAFFIGEAFGAEPWSEANAQSIVDQLRPGDVVLLKASRGQRLERLLPWIQQRFASPEHP